MKLKEFIEKLSRLDPELNIVILDSGRWSDEPLFEEDCKDCPSYANITSSGDVLYIGD